MCIKLLFIFVLRYHQLNYSVTSRKVQVAARTYQSNHRMGSKYRSEFDLQVLDTTFWWKCLPYHLLRVGSKCDLSVSELLFVPTKYWSMTSTFIIELMSSMAEGHHSFPPCFKKRFPVLMCMRNIFILRNQVMQLFRHLSKDHCISSCVKCYQDQGFLKLK